MAVPSGTTTTYGITGNREDIEDFIWDISPMDTPFVSNIARVDASATFHTWQTDVLASAAANRQLEGTDAVINTLDATTQYGNYCQISTKAISVSGTQRAMTHAGIKDELSYQLAKRGKELKRDIEYGLVRNQTTDNGSALTARSLGSVESWLFSYSGNVTDYTSGTTVEYSSGVVTAPTDASPLLSFTEARLNTAIQQCWTDGGDPDVVMVGPVNKNKGSNFSGIATQYRDNQQKGPATLIGSADIYISDFGEHKIVANRHSRDRTALVLDMEYWAMAELRGIQQTELAKTGDSDKRLLLCEYTLVARNPNSSAKIADMITSY